MDWRDFMRGFFGHRDRGGGDQWPPPPPIPEFRREGSGEGSSLDSNGERDRNQNLYWGRRNRRPSRGGDDDGLFENFGNRSFVFGDVFSAVGEMFQEMERSMRDMESFFGNMRIDGDHTGMIPFPGQMPPLPPNIQQSPSPKSPSKDDNIRDLVLKEPDSSPSAGNHKHYIPIPDNAKDKVDRDLDDLYQKSLLDLSDLPVPSKESGPQSSQKSVVPFGFHQGQHSGKSSFQRTYQTFSFRNGRWEGETVKEDQNGKEITKYYQDKDGKRHETTEYFPRDGSSSSSIRPLTDTDITPPPSYDPPRLFQFFDQFFKPRM